MSKSVLQNNNSQDNQRITITVTKELIDTVRKHTENISQFFQECAEEKIKDKNTELLFDLIDNFPRVSIEENTLEILRRSRNEE